MRPMVHSTKHYVQMSLFNVATGVRVLVPLVTAVAVPDKNIVSEVEEGASVKAVYIELIHDQDGANGSEIFMVYKRVSNSIGPTFAEMVAVGNWVGKKNILYTQQGLANNESVGNPSTLIKGWLKIPKSKQRFGLGDVLELAIANPSANNSNNCGFATYKEYT